MRFDFAVRSRRTLTLDELSKKSDFVPFAIDAINIIVIALVGSQELPMWQENGNKLIVFDKDRYAIFEAYELVILCGRNVRQPKGKPETITKEDILIKYGALLE